TTAPGPMREQPTEARLTGEPTEPLDVVAAGRHDARSGVPVDHPPAGGEPSAHQSPSATERGRHPGAPLDRPGVVPLAPVHIPQVGGGHPQGIESRMGIGAKAQVLAQRTVHRQLDTGPSFDRPGCDTRLGAWHEMPDRVRPPTVEAEPTGGVAPGGDRTDHEAAVVTAQIVRAITEAEGGSPEVVGPGDREPRAHDSVAPGGLAGRIVELPLHG